MKKMRYMMLAVMLVMVLLPLYSAMADMSKEDTCPECGRQIDVIWAGSRGHYYCCPMCGWGLGEDHFLLFEAHWGIDDHCICAGCGEECHDFIYCSEKAATCTEPGNKMYYLYCNRCKRYYHDGIEIEKDLAVIPPTGHDFSIDVSAKEATCTEDGYTAHKECSVCGEKNDDYRVIPATGHTVVIDPEVPATCMETGLTEGKHCSVCHEVIVEQQEIPLAGCTIVVCPAVPPTCTKVGLTEGEYCSVCGDTIKEQLPIGDPLGHDWGEWEIITEPELGKAGERQHTCNRCGEVEKETIPALAGYTVTKGQGGTWRKGSNKSFTITVKRSEGDEECFAHYLETLIDGVPADVSAKKGSTIVTIGPKTLEKLNVGEHKVTVRFDDGEAEVKINIQKKVSEPDEVPKTGDTGDLGRGIILLILSLAGLTALKISRKETEL